MRAIRGILVASVLSLFASGCEADLPSEEQTSERSTVAMTGDRDPDSPEALVHKYVTSRDTETMISCMVRRAREAFSASAGSKGGGASFVPSHMKDATTRIEIGKAEVDGERAEVPVTHDIRGEGAESKSTSWIVVVREEGAWRVDPMARPRNPATAKTRMDPEVQRKSQEEQREFMRKQMPVNAAHEDMFEIKRRVQDYALAHDRRLPPSLEALATAYPDVPRVDPWGRPYRFRVKGEGTSAFDVEVSSLGADGREGGSGDDADIQH